MPISGNLRGIFDINIAIAALAANDALMKLALATVPISEAMALRGLVTVFLMLLILTRAGPVQWHVDRRDRGVLLLRTAAEVLCSVTFLLALPHMKLANLSAIQQALPLTVTLCAAVLLGEAVGRYRVLAIMLGFGGVLMIVRPGTGDFNGWSGMALAAMLATVLRDLATRRFSGALPTSVIALASAAGVTALGFSGLSIESWRVPTTDEVTLLALAGAALSIGYHFTIRAMREVPVALIAPFRYAGLLWAIALGWGVFGSFPDRMTVMGATIVMMTGSFICMREMRLRTQVVLIPIEVKER